MDTPSILVSMGFILGGGWVYLRSIKIYKLRRRVSDQPFSKIISAAIGSNVKIKALVVDPRENVTVSPLTQKMGTAFLWHLEIFRDEGKHPDWETVHIFHSTPYLYVHDNENVVAAVDLSSCEFQQYNFDSEYFEFFEDSVNLPEDVKKILTKDEILSKLKGLTLFSPKEFRLREKMFITNEPLYIFGNVSPSPQSEARVPFDLSNGVRKLQSFILEACAMEPENPFIKEAKILFCTNKTETGPLKLDKVYVSFVSEEDFRWNLRMSGFGGLAFAYILLGLGLFIFAASFV